MTKTEIIDSLLEQLQDNIFYGSLEEETTCGDVMALAEAAVMLSEMKTERHGEWFTAFGNISERTCSRCRAAFDIWHYDAKLMHYCPVCGAKMDGVKEDNDDDKG